LNTILIMTDEEAACIRAALQMLEDACHKAGNGAPAKAAQAIRHKVIEAQDAACKATASEEVAEVCVQLADALEAGVQSDDQCGIDLVGRYSDAGNVEIGFKGGATYEVFLVSIE
jgi:hypothetical protein